MPGESSKIFSTRCLVMAALGFVSGLPYTIVNDTATALLADLKIDRRAIGLLGAIGTIYAFKFIWAPLVDLKKIRWLRGLRRPWLFLTQAALTLTIAALALVAPQSAEDSLAPFTWILIVMAVFSATQDIVVNGWTVDAFPTQELGIGSSMYVLGYRVAMIAAGALALVLAKYSGWPFAFVVLAVVMASGPLVVGFSREPHRNSSVSENEKRSSFMEPARELIGRLGKNTLLIFIFILLFRLPDQLATPMQKPLLLDTLGYDLEQFGIARNGIGLVATILGAIVGGILVVRIGITRSLIVAGLLQAISNLGFAWLAASVQPLGGQSFPWTSAPILSLAGVSIFENACGGLVGTAFVAWLMSLCSPRYGASQYALLTAGFALAAGLASAVSGYLAKDWTSYFVWTAVAGIPGMALLRFAVRGVPDLNQAIEIGSRPAGKNSPARADTAASRE